MRRREAIEFILKPVSVKNPAGGIDTSNIDIPIPCQGGPLASHKKGSWSTHSISKISLDGKVYYVDPSYGTGIAEGLPKFCLFLAGFLGDSADYAWRPDGINSDIKER